VCHLVLGDTLYRYRCLLLPRKRTIETNSFTVGSEIWRPNYVMTSRKKWSIEDFHKIAKQRNGTCLSDRYVNMHTKLDFRCGVCGFEWSPIPTSIVSGRWCRKCAALARAEKLKLTIEDMQDLAKRKDGECLSTEYVNSNTHLIWKCHNKDHPPFPSIPSSVKNRGSWCPKCANERKGSYQILTIPLLQKVARQRGGECLSTEYLGVHSKHNWRCSNGHEFAMAPADVKNQGSWCPECNQTWGEKVCREFIENIFDAQFPKVRPKWLINKQGNRLEFDGFNEGLMIAFEHQGEQHYREGVFSKNPEDYEKIIQHDQIKRETCLRRGVALIEVPEIGDRTHVDDLLKFIIDEAENLGVGTKIKRTKFSPNWKKIYSGGSQQLERLKEIAKDRGGQLLSSEWRGRDIPISFRCKERHRFTITPSSVFDKHWCQKCAGNEQGTIEEMREIAAERGGKCLSNEYVNGRTPLQWYCLEHDYTWWNLPNNVKNHKQWCMKCAGRTWWTIEAVKDLAKSRGGKCLSKRYKNTREKFSFRCNKCKHTWKTSLSSLLNGSFCPKCGLEKVLQKTRKTIEGMKHIAESRGGKCISTKYVNSHTHLLFKCSNLDHPSWKATPSNIRRGKWCRLCSIESRQRKS
jgi:hypothetical protein